MPILARQEEKEEREKKERAARPGMKLLKSDGGASSSQSPKAESPAPAQPSQTPSAPRNSAQGVAGMKREEAEQNRYHSAQDAHRLGKAEKELNTHDAGRDARKLHEAEAKKAAEMEKHGLTDFVGYVDGKPVYKGTTGGIYYYDNGMVATEEGLVETLTDPALLASLIVNRYGYKCGPEFGGRNFRFAPWGNRTGHPIGRYPHYHRKAADPKRPGHSKRDQGIGRHRPFETRNTDKKITDQF